MFRYLYHLLVYGNIWIALGASLMAILHFHWNETAVDWTYIATLFGASIFLYAIHRKIGLDENSKQHDIRYPDFIQMSKESNILGVIGFILMVAFGIFIPFHHWVWFIPAVTLSTMYVMPLGKKKLRLRDYGVIKIPSQSLIWAWLIVLIPQVFSSNNISTAVWLIFIEKFLFLFAITIPFDIRDKRVDSAQGVTTIPQLIGDQRSRMIAYLIILVCIIITIFLYLQGAYNLPFIMGLLLSYFLTIILIYMSKGKEKDHWFSFFLDGTLIIQPLLVLSLFLLLGP